MSEVFAASIIKVMSMHKESVCITGTSQTRQNLDWTSQEHGEHLVRAREPIEEGRYHSLARSGEKDMRERG
jgi:hypothetical protein